MYEPFNLAKVGPIKAPNFASESCINKDMPMLKIEINLAKNSSSKAHILFQAFIIITYEINIKLISIQWTDSTYFSVKKLVNVQINFKTTQNYLENQ